MAENANAGRADVSLLPQGFPVGSRREQDLSDLLDTSSRLRVAAVYSTSERLVSAGMINRKVRRFPRQYSLLTATQQWACDWRSYVLARMRANNNHNRAR